MVWIGEFGCLLGNRVPKPVSWIQLTSCVMNAHMTFLADRKLVILLFYLGMNALRYDMMGGEVLLTPAYETSFQTRSPLCLKVFDGYLKVLLLFENQ